MIRLTALSYSPWSEKARWALDHHGIAYTYREHVALVGELELRIRLRKPTGRVTVPVLQDGDRFFTDSLHIAEHAERIGRGRPLFPEAHRAEIGAWNERSEAALVAARARMVLRAAADAAADPESARAWLPSGIPAALQPFLAPVAKKGLEAFIAKYDMRGMEGENDRVLDEALSALDAALAGGKAHLLGDDLTYADIAMAIVLQFVRPVDERYMPVGPGGARAWSNPDLAARYPGLIAWRDALYAKHRT